MFAVKAKLSRRAEELFQKQQREIYLHTDQLFAKLMFWQWLATIVMALVISPQTWAGQTSAIHIHVWASIFLGGAISLFPIWMTRAWPGAAITRYVIAVAQMLMSALLISVTGGRIESGLARPDPGDNCRRAGSLYSWSLLALLRLRCAHGHSMAID